MLMRYFNGCPSSACLWDHLKVEESKEAPGWRELHTLLGPPICRKLGALRAPPQFCSASHFPDALFLPHPVMLTGNKMGLSYMNYVGFITNRGQRCQKGCSKHFYIVTTFFKHKDTCIFSLHPSLSKTQCTIYQLMNWSLSMPPEEHSGHKKAMDF